MRTLHHRCVRFLDRRDAGRRLAGELVSLELDDPVIVALPRGGVPVAFEVATRLGAPLEILAVRKLGAPGNPELAVGAIAEEGIAVLDQSTIARLGIAPATLDAAIVRESAALAGLLERYRGACPAVSLRGRVVVLIDDGVATGLTDLAAVRAARSRGPSLIVVAVPVGASESLAMLGREADGVLCLQAPDTLFSVGSWYRDFAPVSDVEALALLARARR